MDEGRRNRLRLKLSLVAAAIGVAFALTGVAAGGGSGLSINGVGISNGQVLTGTVTWTAQVGGGTVNRVDFVVDGSVKNTSSSSPYTYSLDTTKLTNGAHTFGVTAYPTPGKGQSSSASVSATVSNASSSPPPPPPPTAPSATSAPAVSGSAVVGQSLSTSNGAWSGTTPMTYAYQWSLCNSSGGSCNSISGATSSSIAVTSTMVGSTLKAAVQASNSAGSATATSNASSVITAPTTNTPPASTAAPAITGSATVGQTLSASTGTWSGTTPMTYAYQWQLCSSSGGSCAPVSGATASSFLLPSNAAGLTVKAAVTATNVAGSAAATSAATAVVAAAPTTKPASTVLPVISGTAMVGQTLTSTPGTWTGTTPMTYAYQWTQCNSSGTSCTNIAGATSGTFALTSTQLGSTLRIVVTATNAAGWTSAQSLATAAVVTNTVSKTFDSVTSYLDTSIPSLTNAITVSSASAFTTAVANAKAGQTINVLGTVKIPGEFIGFNRVVSGGTVNVVFEPGAGFTGMAGTRVPAVWIRNSGGWRIWGGTITNPDGNGILVYAMPGPFTWTGFSVSNTGDTCVAVYPVGGNINGLTLKGVAGSADPNLSWDPHAEKGTGIHAWNIADATGGLVQNSVFAADTLDQATGAGVEIDTSQIGANVKVFARATHLGFPIPGTSWLGYAQQQTAGNVVQLWGGSLVGSLDIAYVEGNDIQGRMVQAGGINSGADISKTTVDYGRATGPIMESPLVSTPAYMTNGGIKLGDVSPTP